MNLERSVGERSCESTTISSPIGHDNSSCSEGHASLRSQGSPRTPSPRTFRPVVAGLVKKALLNGSPPPRVCSLKFHPSTHQRYKKVSEHQRGDSFNDDANDLSLLHRRDGVDIDAADRDIVWVRPSSPQRLRRVQTVRQHQEVANDNQYQRSRKERIGDTCLQGIAQHKSVIAEMRPQRRKIKWNSNIDDAGRIPNNKCRIPGLSLDDLHILGNAMNQDDSKATDKSKDRWDMLGNDIRMLESNIEQCLDCIEKFEDEIEEDKEIASKIRAENEDIRAHLMCLPQIQTSNNARATTTTSRQSTQRLVKAKEVLQQKVDDMKEQLKIITDVKTKIEKRKKELLEELDLVEIEDSSDGYGSDAEEGKNAADAPCPRNSGEGVEVFDEEKSEDMERVNPSPQTQRGTGRRPREPATAETASSRSSSSRSSALSHRNPRHSPRRSPRRSPRHYPPSPSSTRKVPSLHIHSLIPPSA